MFELFITTCARPSEAVNRLKNDLSRLPSVGRQHTSPPSTQRQRARNPRPRRHRGTGPKEGRQQAAETRDRTKQPPLDASTRRSGPVARDRSPRRRGRRAFIPLRARIAVHVARRWARPLLCLRRADDVLHLGQPQPRRPAARPRRLRRGTRRSAAPAAPTAASSTTATASTRSATSARPRAATGSRCASANSI